MILSVEGKDGDLLPEHLYGHFHVTGQLTDICTKLPMLKKTRYLSRCCQRSRPVVRLDFRERDDCGAYAICPLAATLNAELDGDWNVAFILSIVQRSFLPDNFTLVVEMINIDKQPLSVMETETLFAKDLDERHYRRRLPQRTVKQEYLDSRPRAPMTMLNPLELFVGDLLVPSALKNYENYSLSLGHDRLFTSDDAGQNRGRLYYYLRNPRLKPAAMDGQKINGRRIGVRDADSDNKKKRDKPSGPAEPSSMLEIYRL